MVDVNYLAALMEEVRDQNKALLEGQKADHDNIAKIPGMTEDIKELKIDMKTVKLAVTETNKQVQNHEERITRIEPAIQT